MKSPGASRVRAQEVAAALLSLGGLLALLLVFSPISRPSSDKAVLSKGKPAPAPPLDLLSGYGESRSFSEHGKVASLFVQMGAYRGGPATFAVVGLSSNSLHKLGNPSFQCSWRPGRGRSREARVQVHLPDWGLGRIYTVVVVNCTFPREVGRLRGGGGQLVITAGYGDSDTFSPPEVFVALEEAPGDYNPRTYSGRDPFPYDYLHCGPPLFGDVSPQRIREWLAYHAKLFGPRSHFVFHDTGGLHSAVMQVLEPWKELGLVSVQDIRKEARYDGYYHNQFLVLNDCLHRTRFMANWTFFFDYDEYVYVPPPMSSFHSLMRHYSAFTQVLMPQARMSHLCAAPLATAASYTKSGKQWAFHELVYKYQVLRPLDDFFKHAVQARHVYATGVHRTEQFEGESVSADASKLRFYHYHGTTSNRGQLCREFAYPDPNNSTLLWGPAAADPLLLDGSMADLAPAVQKFEVRRIGKRPFVP